ncbi:MULTISPECIES: hypothetical protein [Clostridia]|jgi:hypothetical protein|uniref:Uncharacterized protein n=1 Tax=Agathobacter rectalis TaxID=39491 RepID=A0A412RM54_9FIRM|nr:MULTISPECIES: hypothetical protein [Clostridia]MCU6758758.1 hypothetical protein [Brotolimicola acetigignens]RGG67357.1 hypothetical protein DWW96_01475 [Eubacterium sp. AF17-7]RGU24054.1 hypothetical protein DWW89_09470 [Agathobacter rectalis]RHV11910.1 hypothetical protein DXB77_05755 [Clostridium sp. OM05-9]
MNKRYRLCDVEEAVSESEELIDIADDIAEIDEDMQLVISGWAVYIESLNLTLRQGIACVWDEGERLFMPDFDVTVVYEGNIESQEWLYYEQDGFVVTLGNWLNGRMSGGQIEQLWCELVIPETNNTDNESEE